MTLKNTRTVRPLDATQIVTLPNEVVQRLYISERQQLGFNIEGEKYLSKTHLMKILMTIKIY